MRTRAFALMGAIFGAWALPIGWGTVAQAMPGIPLGENLGLQLLMIPGGIFGLIMGLWLSDRIPDRRRAR